MKHSKKFLGKNQGEEADYKALSLAVAEAARRAGVRVSTSEVVDAARLLALYAAISSKPLSLEDYVAVFTSVYAKRGEDEQVVVEAVKRVIIGPEAGRASVEQRIKRDLEALGLDYGDKISRHKLSSLKKSDRARTAYARLKLLGIIRRSRHGEYVVSQEKAKRIMGEIARRYGDIDNALAEAIANSIARNTSLASLLGSELLKYLDLESLNLATLAKLYSNLHREKWLQKVITGIISRKIAEGETPPNPERIYDILRREGMDSRVLAGLLRSNPRLAARAAKDYGFQTVLDIASSIASYDSQRAAEILAHASGLKQSQKTFLRNYITRLGVTYALELAKHTGVAQLLARAVQVRESLIRSLSRPEEAPAHLDMALAEYEKLVSEYNSASSEIPDRLRNIIEGEIRSLASLVHAASTGNTYALLKGLTRQLPVWQALQFLTDVASASSDPKTKRYALMLALLTWKRAVSTTGPRLSRRRKYTVTRGRLDARKAIYGILRFDPYTPIYRRRVRTARYVVVLDKSGSMREYSLTALLASASLAPAITRLVLFDSEVRVIDRLEQASVPKIISLLFKTSFEGYTDVVRALEESTRGLAPSKLVVISDLHQTVPSRKSVDEVLRGMRTSGWRIAVVAPPTLDPRLARRITGIVKLYTVSKPADVARVIRRLIAA
ncbi:VWA domain-containing protein [Hyperthermus butylicus]|uniref:VWA domain-containing protein n=1 Tax=Hyperthermus butylicus TaxID=54248 RepID=UPI00129A8ADB|nr:VWA domain-containing protein [Hyperthermus butylicus]